MNLFMGTLVVEKLFPVNTYFNHANQSQEIADEVSQETNQTQSNQIKPTLLRADKTP
jgi:hypothetical protein